VAELTDDSEMPFGKYEGWLMKDVPAKYLLWISDKGKTTAPVQAYINEHFEQLDDEAEEEEDYGRE